MGNEVERCANCGEEISLTHTHNKRRECVVDGVSPCCKALVRVIGSASDTYQCTSCGDYGFEPIAGVPTIATRASSPSPLTAEEAKERAQKIVGTVFRNTCASPETLQRVIVDRIASELMAVAPSVGEASALTASMLPTGVHNALHAAREALERHFTPTGITDHAYIQGALKAVNRELKLERATPSTSSSSAEPNVAGLASKIWDTFRDYRDDGG